MKQFLKLVMLLAGVIVSWWLVTGLVLPLLGVALGLAWWLLKIAILVFFIYWAIEIFRKWNGTTSSSSDSENGGTTSV